MGGPLSGPPPAVALGRSEGLDVRTRHGVSFPCGFGGAVVGQRQGVPPLSCLGSRPPEARALQMVGKGMPSSWLFLTSWAAEGCPTSTVAPALSPGEHRAVQCVCRGCKGERSGGGRGKPRVLRSFLMSAQLCIRERPHGFVEAPQGDRMREGQEACPSPSSCCGAAAVCPQASLPLPRTLSSQGEVPCSQTQTEGGRAHTLSPPAPRWVVEAKQGAPPALGVPVK